MFKPQLLALLNKGQKSLEQLEKRKRNQICKVTNKI